MCGRWIVGHSNREREREKRETETLDTPNVNVCKWEFHCPMNDIYRFWTFLDGKWMLLINKRTSYVSIVISNRVYCVCVYANGVYMRPPSHMNCIFANELRTLSISAAWFNFRLSFTDCVQCAMIWFNLYADTLGTVVLLHYGMCVFSPSHWLLLFTLNPFKQHNFCSIHFEWCLWIVLLFRWFHAHIALTLQFGFFLYSFSFLHLQNV